MSNPTPILNNINAFDATKGTTISFNIIGGTDIVRSNIVYIYDLSTNDLICTHLYISTESIHELPPNTNPSIVYASGKSSADFVNNKNYYLQIQTFTNTAGTAGGSGMSVAKTFWCLFDPALSVNAIPAAISTTSYNVGATYTTNITDVTIPVTNIIQQYKFDLYTATGTLVQTSGNIIGSGEQEGTSTTYNITYNFSGLVVNNSYYVIVTTTSTEGMTVSAQSNTFTVSIETPTLGEATVVNNACDGYISVTSNLSGEYGGSASGEIATFETDSVNDVSSLKVTLEPQQDLHGYNKPWIGGAGKNKMPTVIGGTSHGVTAVVNEDGSVTLNGTASSAAVFYSDYFTIKAGTYIITSGIPTREIVAAYLDGVSGSASEGARLTFDEDRTLRGVIQVYSGQTASNVVMYPMLRLASETDDTYEPYSNICPISGYDEVSANVVGKNLVDWVITENTFETAYNGFGQGKWQNKMPIPNLWYGKTITYSAYIRAGSNGSQRVRVWFYKDGVYVPSYVNGSAISENQSGISYATITIPDDGSVNEIAFGLSVSGSTVSNPQVELGSTATDYEPYQGQTYTADLGQTVYGGTVDLVSGEVVIDRAMVDLGSLNWSAPTASGRMSASAGAMVITSSTNLYNVISDTYATITARAWYDATATGISICGAGYGTDGNIGISDPNLAGKTSAEAKSYVTGIYAVYPLATPQTYQLTPQEIQTLVGTNNVWSDSGDVEITYNIPITNLLVKRQDVADVSGTWLTLYSQPVTQASDMDFTFIDFLNQYGKTYKYALVPLLTQTQSGVEVEVEGGYTVSDEVQSIFDGVFIANSNGSQKLKAATEYGDLETNQDVGVLTTIGGKYPFVVSNSNLNYHSGSISALIVPSDFYTNGDLDRLSIVERREAIEQFLTDKTAKILKDWNGNIWLITFVDNVEVSFVDDYGMGLGTLSAKWVEIGDVNDQTDLKQTGLI